MRSRTAIDKAMTVNDITARHPDTIGVFNDFGIDACCGGDVTLAEAAARDVADLDALTTALSRAASGAEASR